MPNYATAGDGDPDPHGSALWESFWIQIRLLFLKINGSTVGFGFPQNLIKCNSTRNFFSILSMSVSLFPAGSVSPPPPPLCSSYQMRNIYHFPSIRPAPCIHIRPHGHAYNSPIFLFHSDLQRNISSSRHFFYVTILKGTLLNGTFLQLDIAQWDISSTGRCSTGHFYNGTLLNGTSIQRDIAQQDIAKRDISSTGHFFNETLLNGPFL